MILGLFASSIQALVFSTLSAAYIGEAIEEHSVSIQMLFFLSLSYLEP